MSPIIEVSNLSKAFIISHEGNKESYTSLRDVMSKRTKKLFSFSKSPIISREKFWALNDVNFEIEQGDRVGIIGRNGAGKSTLLKILSRITEPTKGSIKICGRVASLLEVGTGFHPELTGRENIFLNGAILGMGRNEIKRKFDEIVDFSGVEKFLDTPVKRYSSGMYVRLAFAVAAHLEPEILIVDEVLAVGDAEFQKKCLGKMKEVSGTEGRTVLFVSHNMAAVKTLCNKGIVLSKGTKSFEGTAGEAVNFYQAAGQYNDRFDFEEENLAEAPGNDNIRVVKFSVLPLKGSLLTISSGLCFEVIFYNNKQQINLDATFELKTSDEVVIFHHGALITTNNDSQRGIYKVRGELPPYTLNAGIYYFKLIFGENQRYELFSIDSALQFEVVNESLGSNSNILPGVLRPNIQYNCSYKGVR